MMSDNDFIAKVCNYDFKNFINYNNVLGIAKGKKIKNGIYTSDNCLTIFVEKKLPSNLLNKNEFIPSLYKGIKTDVVETGKISSLSLISKNRPVIGGYSAGVIGSTAGTIGCTATNENSTEYYLLSNNHVFANENRAKIGTPILQPGPYDGGNIENDIIGYLADYEPISFSTSNRSPKNYIDAAIALCDYNDISNIIALQGAITGTTHGRVGMKVKKTGRTTEFTTGKILYTNASLMIAYEGGYALFVNQIITNAMSESGDSGSILLTNSNKAVGLLFAGSNSYSIFIPISAVLKTLNIKLL